MYNDVDQSCFVKSYNIFLSTKPYEMTVLEI